MLCGEALQHLNQPLRAIMYYERVMEVISMKKVSCTDCPSQRILL